MKDSNSNTIKKLAYLGLFASVAIISGYVESLIPFFNAIYGVKIGLANLMILFVLLRYGMAEAYLVSLVRILIIGFMFGNGSSIIFSIAGASLSIVLMSVMLKSGKFSLIFVSIIGGLSHNVGQLIVACIWTKTPGLFTFYGPILLISGMLAGLAIGFLIREVNKRIP